METWLPCSALYEYMACLARNEADLLPKGSTQSSVPSAILLQEFCVHTCVFVHFFVWFQVDRVCGFKGSGLTGPVRVLV